MKAEEIKCPKCYRSFNIYAAVDCPLDAHCPFCKQQISWGNIVVKRISEDEMNIIKARMEEAKTDAGLIIEGTSREWIDSFSYGIYFGLEISLSVEKNLKNRMKIKGLIIK